MGQDRPNIRSMARVYWDVSWIINLEEVLHIMLKFPSQIGAALYNTQKAVSANSLLSHTYETLPVE